MKKFLYINLIIIFYLQFGFCFKESYYFYAEGLLDIQRKDYNSAIKNFEKVISYDSEAKDVYKQLIFLYLITNNKEKLKSIFNNKIEKTLSYDELLNIANFLFLYGEDESSKILYEKLYEENPNNAEVILNLAKIYSFSDLEKSIEFYKKYLQINPTDTDAYLQLGIVQYRRGNKTDAFETLKKLNNLDPNNPEIKFILNELLLNSTTSFFSSRFEDLENYYLEEIKKNPQDQNLLASFIFFLLNNNKYEKAEIYIEKLISFSRNKDFLPEYYILISEFYEYKKDYKNASKYLKKFLKFKESENEILYIKLGYYYLNLKRYYQAEKILKYANKNFNSERTNTMLLYFYLERKNYYKAIKVLENIKKFAISFKRTNFYLGMCYDQLKKFNEAEKYLLEMIKEDPNDHEALNYLGYLYADRNIKLQDAEEYITRALELQPTNYAYIDSLGWVYYRKGLYEKAEELLEKAASLNEDPIVYEHVGDVKFKLKKYDEALKFYEKSYDIRNNKEIKKKIRLVNRIKCKH